jgi:serine/threonine protein kinase
MSKTKQIELGKKILGKEGFPATSFQRVSRGRFGSKNKYPHPNILKHLYCVEEDDNFRYFSFESSPVILQEWANSKCSDAIPAHSMGLQQLDSGLAFVHDKQHVHLDVCPADIFISVIGDRRIVSDFDLCKGAHDSGGCSDSNQGV